MTFFSHITRRLHTILSAGSVFLHPAFACPAAVMLLFTVFMWVSTVVMCMFSGQQQNRDHEFCHEMCSLVQPSETLASPTNSTPMLATCSPMQYSFRRRVIPRDEIRQRGFTWVEIPTDRHVGANPNPDQATGSSRMNFGAVILRPNLPSTIVPHDDGDMAVLRFVLEHQTRHEPSTIDEPSTIAAAEQETLLHPSPVIQTATMTGSPRSHMTVPRQPEGAMAMDVDEMYVQGGACGMDVEYLGGPGFAAYDHSI